jgi:hypothetical protein
MMSPRYRMLVIAGLGLLLAWLVTFVGFRMADHFKVTPAKVRAYADALDLNALSPAARAKALKELARKLNSLSMDERRQARLDGTVGRLFGQMTEAEKSQFIDDTMPTGFKQMISAFEDMSAEKRQRAVRDALKNLREAQARMREGGGSASTNAPPLSEDLQRQMAALGLRTFYSQSSAETKAEMAPVLEEMQRLMEGGRFIFDGRQRNPNP